MKDVVRYKGFIGSVHYSDEDKVFHGKIIGIDDLVTFEGQSVKELIKAFHEAVDDYLALCKETGKEPPKSYKGSFNVRVSPDIHRQAAVKAAMIGISLNQLVHRALQREVEEI